MPGGAFLILLIAQAATVPSASADSFDLRKYEASDDCKTGNSGGGIVVCGRPDPDRYRHKEIAGADTYEQAPLLAETNLFGNVKGDVHVESHGMPDGSVSQRVMIRLKTPL